MGNFDVYFCLKGGERMFEVGSRSQRLLWTLQESQEISQTGRKPARGLETKRL